MNVQSLYSSHNIISLILCTSNKQVLCTTNKKYQHLIEFPYLEVGNETKQECTIHIVENILKSIGTEVFPSMQQIPIIFIGKRASPDFDLP